MEENNRKEYYPHMHRPWKWVLGVLIVLVAFWVGFKAGEFCTIFRAECGYGYPMMGYGGMMGGYGYPPSYYGGYATPQGQAVPPSATSTPAPYYYGPGGMMRMMWGYYYPPQATSTK